MEEKATKLNEESHMAKVTIGIDIAKNIFHMVFINASGKVLKRAKRKRKELLSFIANTESSLIVMEACGSTYYWAREFKKLGHEVKAIAPQYVVPFRKGNKNDYNDALAIAEASQRDSMRFVPIKNEQQQALQVLHRVREQRIKSRTALGNQIRGLLAEFGVALPKGMTKLMSELPFVLEDAENGLPDSVRFVLLDLLEELEHLKGKVKEIDARIQQSSEQSSLCKRLMTMPGIGPIVSTILYASINDGSQFQNGRHFSAWLGIVPRQYTTGDNPNLKGISKRGNGYLRMQLINGARSVMNRVENKKDKVSLWCQELKGRLPFNKAVVALANKMARMAWAMLRHNEDYKLKAA